MQKNRPPFFQFPVLRSERLILREEISDDASYLQEISFYDGVPAMTADDVFEFSKKIRSDYLQGKSVHWVITASSSGQVLGTVGFYRGFNENVGEVGYVLKPMHRGRGYMVEALKLIQSFGWCEMGLQCIKAITSVDNLPSIQTLNRSGLVLSKSSESEHLFIIRSPRLQPAD